MDYLKNLTPSGIELELITLGNFEVPTSTSQNNVTFTQLTLLVMFIPRLFDLFLTLEIQYWSLVGIFAQIPTDPPWDNVGRWGSNEQSQSADERNGGSFQKCGESDWP